MFADVDYVIVCLSCFRLRRSPDHGTVEDVVGGGDGGVTILTFKKIEICAKLMKPKL